MKVSIITVTYNSSTTIEDTVKSVLVQTHPDIEYIIVDGDSTDNTLQKIEPYSDKLSKFVSEKDSGMYDALNKGIKLATGDIIGILNSDDFYTDKFVIEEVVKIFLEEHSDAVYADLQYVDSNHTNKIIRNWKSGNYKPGDFLYGWMPPHPTFFVKKDIYRKFGNFSMELKSAADYELMLRFIHKHQIRLSYLKRVIVKMRAGGMSNSSLKNRMRANKEDRKAWSMNQITPRFYTLWFKPLRKILQYLK
ncbi:MAG: glycosyl transferase [Verrucomicrobia bacterium]|nr:glycosyl transferase [Verrucomicrobiota bacterium]